MVVTAILSVLAALLMVGVQFSRETARRAGCSNHLRQQLLSLHEFQCSHPHFPAGRLKSRRIEYSWCVALLPHLEQQDLYQALNQRRPWKDDGKNWIAAQTNVKVFRCPSAITKFDGKTDYGGVMGSTLTVSPGFDFENGVMVEVGRRRKNFIRPAQVEDGLSQTIAIAECADRRAVDGGLWVTGYNAFSHDNGTINAALSDDIFSRHPSGAMVGFADGHAAFLSQSTPPRIVGSLCTRNGGEAVGSN